VRTRPDYGIDKDFLVAPFSPSLEICGGPVMSRKAAIQLALATQMAMDGKRPIGLNGTLCGPIVPIPDALANNADPDAVRAYAQSLRPITQSWASGEGSAGYDQISLRNFFAKVAFLLRSDDPPLKFNWPKIDPAAVANCSLYLVIELIATETVSLDEKPAEGKS
jgi:hypothetical protein